MRWANNRSAKYCLARCGSDAALQTNISTLAIARYGAALPNTLVKRAAERGVTAMALTVKIRLDLGQSMPSTMRKSRSTPSERATSASW